MMIGPVDCEERQRVINGKRFRFTRYIDVLTRPTPCWDGSKLVVMEPGTRITVVAEEMAADTDDSDDIWVRRHAIRGYKPQ